jgi:DNA-binding transcriptional LysR family regulator
LDIRRYEAFVEATGRGTMSAAAKKLGYTPSGIIRLINALEDEVGFPVLARSSTGVFPTPEGERLLPIFKKIIEYEERAQHVSARIRGLSEGTLSVGALASLATFWLPAVLRDYQARFPDVHVNVVSSSNARQFALLADHQIDCCLCHEGSRRTGIDWLPLGRQEVVVWAHRDLPIAQHGSVDIAELDGKPFIATNPDDGSLFDDLMLSHGIEPDFRYTTSGWSATYALVSAGLGVSVCGGGIAEMQGGNVVALQLRPRRYLEFGIATPAGNGLSPALEEFIAIAGNYEGQWPTYRGVTARA